ncbi:MAG: hypothetical protein JJ971_05495 [Balneolaceae bacterium]|nr:hypothetical protein [Balneolaceae bacterium]MBO6545831.1 hypothetical protein [Balneolaceae bacterium]MBO6647227.1 hypothetical protein [Balneolaceae bacterium]
MFGIEALDIVIGLIFIYLLFSLFVSIINEMLSSILQVRGKELKFSIERMIGLKLKNILYGNSRINKVKYRSSIFYGSPFWGIYKWLINFFSSGVELRSNQIEKKITNQALPSKISRETFADALIDIVGDEELREELFKQAPFLEKAYKKAKGGTDDFKKEVEKWFDEIMTYTSEWYKQKLRIVLIVLGFLTAAFFNVDTFSIVKKLNDDPQARAAIVAQARQFIDSYENEQGRIVLKEDSTNTYEPNETVISKELGEIKKSYSSQYSDTIKKTLKATDFIELTTITDSVKKDSLIIALNKAVDDSLANLLKENYPNLIAIDSVYQQIARLKQEEIAMASSVLGLGWDIETHGSYWEAIRNQLHWYSIIGWLITALAISMGAPFWFDLLKKVINIKEELKPKEEK